MSLRIGAFALILVLCGAGERIAHSQSIAETSTGGAQMTQLARGTFEVKITPQAENKSEGATLGRMSMQKTFSGDMQGTGEGEMLTAMGLIEGSAVYVAVERLKGALHGKRGTFALSHRGTMSGGKQSLSIEIAPDSGTDELVGISGTMMIKIEGGKHFYELSYTLPK